MLTEESVDGWIGVGREGKKYERGVERRYRTHQRRTGHTLDRIRREADTNNMNIEDIIVICLHKWMSVFLVCQIRGLSRSLHRTADLHRTVRYVKRGRLIIVGDRMSDVAVAGHNTCGQLGTGHRRNLPNLVPVRLPARGAYVAGVALGDSHMLVLATDGSVYATGSNCHGQLGIRCHPCHPLTKFVPTLTPVEGIPGDVTRVAAGARHSLLVSSDGSVYATGSNDQGQLGLGREVQWRGRPRRLPLPHGDGTVTDVAAGNVHSLVLTSAGAVLATGDNRHGQLGLGDEVYCAFELRRVAGLAADAEIRTIVASSCYSVCLANNGRVFAFGCNEYYTGDDSRPRMGLFGVPGIRIVWTPTAIESVAGVVVGIRAHTVGITLTFMDPNTRAITTKDYGDVGHDETAYAENAYGVI